MANKKENTEQNNVENEELKRLQEELEKVNKEKEELNQKNKDLEEQIKKDTESKKENIKDVNEVKKGKEKTYMVYTPVSNFNGIVAGVQFAYGKAKVREGWVLNWFKEKGYKVEEIEGV